MGARWGYYKVIGRYYGKEKNLVLANLRLSRQLRSSNKLRNDLLAFCLIRDARIREIVLGKLAS
jgi:hypothetical protein